MRYANERWDGSGYPDGLAREEIPYAARLLPGPGVALGEMIEERGGVEAVQREVQEGARELAIFSEITPQFNTLLDLKQLLDRVLQTLGRHWPESRLHMLLRDEHTEELVVRAVAGDAGTLCLGVRLVRGEGLAGWVLEHRESLNVEDIRQVPRARQRDETIRSRMLVPLVNEARAVGVLDLGEGRTIEMLERSWGVAAYPLDGTTARDLVDNADTRAYARKRATV